MTLEPNALKNRIAAEQKHIRVESFTDIAFEGAWKGRARSFWATAAVGAVVGAAVGLIAPFFPVVVGAYGLAAAANMIATSVPIYASLGMASGFAVGVLVGATSGAAASVAKERERREKGEEIDLALSVAPNARIEQPVAPDAPKARRSLLTVIKEDYVNLPTLAAFSAFGAAGGAIMVGAYSAAGPSFLPIAEPAMKVLLPATQIAAGKTFAATAAYTIGVMGTFGAVFGINMPKIAGDMTRFVGDMLGGKIFGSEKGPSAEQVREPVFKQEITVSALDGPVLVNKPPRFESYCDMLAHQSSMTVNRIAVK